MGEKRKKLDAFSQLLVAIGAAILANGAINHMPLTGQLFVFLAATVALVGGLWMFAVVHDFIRLNLQPKWYLRQLLRELSEVESDDLQDADAVTCWRLSQWRFLSLPPMPASSTSTMPMSFRNSVSFIPARKRWQRNHAVG